MLESLICFLDF